MDEASKAKLRKRARRRFEGTVAALCLIAVGMGGMILDFRIVERELPKLTLGDKHHPLLYERIRFSLDRARLLAFYPPPSDPAETPRWIHEVTAFVDYPTPLFTEANGRIAWAVPLASPALTALVDSALLTPPRRPKPPLARYGAVTIRLVDTPSAVADGWLIVVRDSARHKTWGAHFQIEQEALAFYRRLSQPRDTTALALGDPAWMLSDVFALPRSSNTAWLPGLRAVFKDSVIFASPGLDTTRVRYTSAEINHLREEIYVAPRGIMMRLMALMRQILWAGPAFMLLLILPFYRWYRRVMQLTEPEPPAPVSPRAPINP